MNKSKKYSYAVTQDSDSSWSASILRQVSSTKKSVSKKQDKFATEDEAKKWAETELDSFLQTQVKRNIRKNEQRKTNQLQREERSIRKAAKTAAEKELDAAKNADIEDASSSDAATDVWPEPSTKTTETKVTES